MGLWDKLRQGVENADLDGLKGKLTARLDAAARKADAQASEPILNWRTLKSGLEKIDTDAIKRRTTAVMDKASVALEARREARRLRAEELRLREIEWRQQQLEELQDFQEAALKPTSATHGTASLATSRELERVGMGVKVRTYGVSGPVDTTGLLLGTYTRGFLTYRGDAHHLVVAASGAGKFQAGVGVWLLNGLAGATVLIDPKGEACRAYAEKLPESLILDPWDEAGQGTRSLNLLDRLTPDNPSLIDDARALGEAMILPSGGDTHWDNTARNLAAALLLYIALDPHEADTRHLLRLRELVTLPWQAAADDESLENLLIFLQSSAIANGTVRRAANAMLGRSDKERQSILSTLERDTAWLESPQVQAVLTRSDIDLDALAATTGTPSGPVLFVVIPPRYINTHRSWLRLVIAASSNAFKRVRIEDADPWRRRRHIVIDEFPALGSMSFVENDIAVARGYDIQYHLLVQNLTQLRDTYSVNWETFIANSLVQAFGMQDMFTAEYFSKMMGVTTVTAYADSQSSSRSFSSSNSWQGLQGSSSSSDSAGTNTSTSRSDVGRPLRTPDELRTMPAAMQVLFLRGMSPIQARLTRLYEMQK